MRILILSPAHPLRGGIAASSERLAIELQKEGHNVQIFSFSLQYPSILFPGKSQYTTDPAPKGLPIRAVLNSINPLNWLFTGKKIGLQEPDVIMVRYWLPFMGPSLGTAIRFARFFSSKNPHVVALVDNIIPHEKRIGDVPFSRYFANSCDAFVTMSRAVKDEMADFSKGKPVQYAAHPIYDQYGTLIPKDKARTLLGIPPKVPAVLFFGFIRAYKGLDLLIKALGEPELHDVHLVIAGESYEPWENYSVLLKENGLEGRVHLFQDFIPTDEVNRYFSAADLVAQPYKTATQSGISQIAYHFEKPMLVTNVGGLPEIVPHGKAGYVVPKNPKKIAEAIHDFFSKNKENELIKGVREEKKRFSWSNLAKAILAEKK